VTGNPLAVLHVLAPADAGGLETVVQSLAAGHSAMGHTIEIAAVLETPTSPFVEEAREAGLTVHVIESPARSIRAERRGVRDLLTRRRFDVLHSHGYRSDILDIGIARKLHVPSVTTLHGFSATDRKARVYEWLQIRGARRASAIVAVSTNVADRLIAGRARAESVHLIRNATTRIAKQLDARAVRERLNLSDGIQLGWIGRLSSEKGPDVMLEALPYLTGLPITLSFIGDGPDRPSLEARTRQLGLSERVRFHGRVPHAAQLLTAFDVIVLSSRTEGTPIVVLEAMGADVPIVATSVGGVPEMLSAAEAILVAAEDPSALATGIRAVLADGVAARERATRAHSRLLAEFSTEAWLARYESVYRSVQPEARRSST
jgi:glycosyltransferase involved in cell wall biosynthesis